MPVLELSAGNGLAYDHRSPEGGGCTFVLFNALTGDKAAWEAGVAPALRAAGHGTLTFNYRGQAGSPFTLERFTAAQIVEDAAALLGEVKPARPVHAGLSIGGLFAIRAHLAGGNAAAEGLVLINTLRRDRPRLAWLNDALVRTAEVGGLALLRDLYTPLLANEDWQAANREQFLKPGAYRPIDRADGAYLLLASGGGADWDVPYERLTLPVLNVSGLQDRVFYDADDVAALCARLPRVRRVDMADAGHLVPAERPEALARAMADLAAGIAGGQSGEGAEA